MNSLTGLNDTNGVPEPIIERDIIRSTFATNAFTGNASIIGHPTRFRQIRRVHLASRCGKCNFLVYLWVPGHHGCPECSHFNVQETIELAKEANSVYRAEMQGRDISGKQLCICPCECPEDADDQDADYEYQSEKEDDTDVTNHLSGSAARGEESFARQYGWKTNLISDEGQDIERRIFFEAPGHYLVAQTHEIDRPAESSFATRENTIGVFEAQQLNTGLEPWELEAVHIVTGRSYDDLLQIFPEARYLELPTGWRLPEPIPTDIIPGCIVCNRPATEQCIEWIASGTTRFCSGCQLLRSPERPGDDPDRDNIDFSLPEMLTHCHCRCRCILSSVHPAAVSCPIAQATAQALLNPENWSDLREARQRPRGRLSHHNLYLSPSPQNHQLSANTWSSIAELVRPQLASHIENTIQASLNIPGITPETRVNVSVDLDINIDIGRQTAALNTAIRLNPT